MAPKECIILAMLRKLRLGADLSCASPTRSGAPSELVAAKKIRSTSLTDAQILAHFVNKPAQSAPPLSAEEAAAEAELIAKIEKNKTRAAAEGKPLPFDGLLSSQQAASLVTEAKRKQNREPKTETSSIVDKPNVPQLAGQKIAGPQRSNAGKMGDGARMSKKKARKEAKVKQLAASGSSNNMGIKLPVDGKPLTPAEIDANIAKAMLLGAPSPHTKINKAGRGVQPLRQLSAGSSGPVGSGSALKALNGHADCVDTDECAQGTEAESIDPRNTQVTCCTWAIAFYGSCSFVPTGSDEGWNS
jgi:hypothetical protein